MPVTDYEIATYGVSMISSGDSNQIFATISLFDAAGNALAFLKFYEPSVLQPLNEFREDLGYPVISYPSSSFAGVVDILRNEKPLYFTFFDYRPERLFGAIGTSRESVGEGGA
ncbi:MAG: hypothetical protein OEV01_14785 [Nitrospira sp.]|nr:hypothetical protein [Nitrospira sp.]MDH4305528.1 hypothetical protein [Nitrospira sp.]